jgi:hypothetical protein
MMTKDDYRAALVALDLSQIAAAKFLHANERTSRRWATGGAPIPWNVEMVIRIMLYYRIMPADVRDLMMMEFGAVLDEAQLTAIHAPDETP